MTFNTCIYFSVGMPSIYIYIYVKISFYRSRSGPNIGPKKLMTDALGSVRLRTSCFSGRITSTRLAYNDPSFNNDTSVNNDSSFNNGTSFNNDTFQHV